jgi:hypothetical protein
LRAHPSDLGDLREVELAGDRLNLVPADDVISEAPRRRQPAFEDDFDDAYEEKRVGRRANEVMLRAVLSGLRATGIDQHHLAAASADRVELLVRVGARRHLRTIRDLRIGAEHEVVVGPTEIRDGGHELVTEHEVPDEIVRLLIDRRARVRVLGADQGSKRHDREKPADVVRDAPALVRRDGILAVLTLDLG